MVKASEFHPMRGHVFDGQQVLLSSGQVLTIKSATRGWRLYDDSGKSVGQAEGAYDLTSAILGAEEATK